MGGDVTDAKGGIRVDLAGGYVSLKLDVNLSTLNDSDRRFVLDILHRVVSRANPLPIGYDPECGDGRSLVAAMAAFEAPPIIPPEPGSGVRQYDGSTATSEGGSASE
jgi:hypothetical protein